MCSPCRPSLPRNNGAIFHSMLPLSSQQSHLRFADVVVSALSAPLPDGVPNEDLEGVAWAAYHRWVHRVKQDPATDTPSFLYAAVRNAMIDEIRRVDRLSYYTRIRLNRINGATEVLKEKLGRPPNIKQVAEATGFKQRQIHDTLMVGAAAREESFAVSFEEAEEEIGGESVDPAARASNLESFEILQSAVAALPADQRQVMELVVLEGTPVAHVAAMTNLSCHKVRALRKQAVAQMRANPALRELADVNEA